MVRQRVQIMLTIAKDMGDLPVSSDILWWGWRSEKWKRDEFPGVTGRVCSGKQVPLQCEWEAVWILSRNLKK